MPVSLVGFKIDSMASVSFRNFGLCCVFMLGSLACQRLNIGYQDVQLSSASEKSCGFVQNSAGARVSWKSQVPVKFSIDQSVPAEFRPAIFAAAEDWNRAAGRTFLVVSQEIVTSPQWAVDGKNIIYWVQKEGVFSSVSQQAKSLLRWTGTNLSDVDVLINAANWNFYLTTPVHGNDLHLESLLVHELGHALGLAHQESTKSVMYMSLGGSVIRDTPTQAPDLEDIGCEYL